MPIQVLECPSCGGNIDFYDETKLFGRCVSCGREVQRTEPTKIVIQKQYDDSNDVIRRGMEHLELGHLVTAQEFFEEYIEKNPKRYEGYYGVILAQTDNFNAEYLDCASSDDIDLIDDMMDDIRRIADPGTSGMIETRLNQLYDEYREYIISGVKEDLEEKQKEVDALRTQLTADHDAWQIDALKEQIRVNTSKRENDLKEFDRKIARATFFERHRKLFLWLFIEAFRILFLLFVHASRSVRIGVNLTCGILLWAIVIYAYVNRNGPHKPFPIVNRLQRNKNELARTPIIPVEQSRALSNYAVNERKLNKLLQEQQVLEKRLADVSQMDIRELVSL